jgi:hypothetical protein
VEKPKVDWKKAEETAVIKITADDLSDHDKIRRERPTRERLIEEFGESSYKVTGKDKEGREKYRIDVDGRKNVKKLFEVYAKEHQLKSERAEKVQARIPRAEMINRSTGEKKVVPTWSADAVGRSQGFVERPYWGRPSYRKVYNS